MSARPAHKSACGQPQTSAYTLAGSLWTAVKLGATSVSRLVRSWGSSGWYRFALLIVDDKVGFRGEVRALLQEQGTSVVGGLRRSAKSVTGICAPNRPISSRVQ